MIGPASLVAQGDIPPEAIPIVNSFFLTIAVVALGIPIIRALTKRWERGAQRPLPPSPEITTRLERIEQAVDTIAIEVERISEGQRFVTRIMAERAAPAGASDGPAAQVRQPLALGAGAMEPIVVPERERVRQRVITPH